MSMEEARMSESARAFDEFLATVSAARSRDETGKVIGGELLHLAAGRSKNEMAAALLKNGWLNDEANTFVDNLEKAFLRYNGAVIGRRQYGAYLLWIILLCLILPFGLLVATVPFVIIIIPSFAALAVNLRGRASAEGG